MRRTDSARPDPPRPSRRGRYTVFFKSKAQVDRLELVRLDLKRAGEIALARLVNPDAIGAHGRRRVERQRFVKRAEFRERDRTGDDQPAAAVGDLEAIDRLGHVGVLAVRDLADHAADRDLLARPIGRPVGVDVGARSEPLRDLRGHAQSRAGDVRSVEDQVAQAAVAARARASSRGARRRRPRSRPRARPSRRRRPERGPRRGPCPSSCPGQRPRSGLATSSRSHPDRCRSRASSPEASFRPSP